MTDELRPMFPNYAEAFEKLHAAVVAMATSEQPLRMRVCDAYEDHVDLIPARNRPSELADDFRWLDEIFSHVDPTSNPHGRSRVNAALMSDDEARDVAERIVWMLSRAAEYADPGEFEDFLTSLQERPRPKSP